MKKSLLQRHHLILMTIFYLSLFSVVFVAYGLYLEAKIAGRGLGYSLGVDFFVLYMDMVRFIKTGVLYKSPCNHFFNTPLMSFLCLPYTFLPLVAAKMIKLILIIIIYALSIRIIFHYSYRSPISDKDLFISVLCFTITFFVAQLYLLNVYVEVMFCLLLSVYFYNNSKFILCAFFLSLAIALKIFLLPLVVAPLIAKKHDIFIYSTIFGTLFLIVSLLIFGIETHADMIDAILIDYANRRIQMFEASALQAFIYSGLSDFPAKLYIKNIIPASHVNLYSTLISIAYAILSFILCLRITIITHKNKGKDYYPEVFATLLLITLVFVFRYDFGALLFPLLPLVMKMKKVGKYAIYAVLLLGVHYFVAYDCLNYLGFSSLSLLVYLFSPYMLIGIVLILLMYYYWFSSAALK